MADRGGEFVAGMVIGTLVGIGLGMLLAPLSGQDTRQRIRMRADEMGDRIRSGAGDLGGRVRETVRETADDIARRGRSAYDEGSRRVRDAYDRGRERVQRGETPGGTEDPGQV